MFLLFGIRKTVKPFASLGCFGVIYYGRGVEQKKKAYNSQNVELR